MNTSKIIKGVVGGGRYTVTAPIVKEDYGLYLKIEGLELPSTYEVDFSNDEHSGSSVTMIGNADGVLIPNQFISSGKDVFAFLYHVGVDYGRTVYKFRIPNKCRPDRTNEQPTPEEQSVIDQAISALNSAVEQTAQDVIDADASAQSASTSAQSASVSAEEAEEARDEAFNASVRASGHEFLAKNYAEQASASATASAQSAEQSAINSADAQDSAEEAQGYASASAQSATASANSASQASGYAQSASASAQSAGGYASQAQTSAQTASTKASEASQSAQTASQKATEATQSASQASGYAQTAQTAKTDAQTAQGLAESARNSAITAKTDAESARDEAQSIVDGISGKVEQIDQNTADIESLEDDRFKPYAVDTASGAVASFSDGADNIPLKSLIVNIDPVQDLSQGDPSPENICPISGWEGMEIQHDGVNLFDGEMENGDINQYTGENNGTSSSRYRSKNYIPIRAGSYYFHSANRTSGTVRVFFYDANKTFIYFTAWNVNAVNTFTPEKIRYARFRFSAAKVDGDEQISINSPSSVTDYVPYVGQTIPISWQTEAGTVYGGKLDVLTGKLTVYPYYASYNGETLTGEWISDRDVYAVGTTPTIGAQVVNIGAEGTEYQLDPHEIASLLGANNIWADTGDSEVAYRADTKMYIEKLTQPEEDDMIADSAIASGQFFMIGNSLYRALANIASGATITVGTNAQRVSLADALNLVNA